MRKFKETEDSRHIYQNQLEKACFQHDMAYGGFKDLPRRKDSDKLLRYKAFNIAKNLKYDENQRTLLQLFINFLMKSLLVHTKEQELILI